MKVRFGPSPLALAAIKDAATQSNWYGDPEAYDLRQKLSELTGVSVNEIVLGSGIDDLLGLVVRLFVEPGTAVVTSDGAYPTFQYHVRAYGGQLVTVPYDENYHNDLSALVRRAAEAGAKLLYIANPDNPTGTVQTYAEIEDACRQLPEDCVLLLDEAYIEFAPPAAHSPRRSVASRMIRFRTFSKAYGMAGVRIGYLLADAAVVQALDKVRLHFGVGRIAQDGALAALSDTEFVAHVVRETAIGREEYARLAESLNLHAVPSATNFVLIHVGTAARSIELVEQMAQRGVFIRRPGVAPLDACIRITVGTRAEREQLAHILTDCVSELNSEAIQRR